MEIPEEVIENLIASSALHEAILKGLLGELPEETRKKITEKAALQADVHAQELLERLD